MSNHKGIGILAILALIGVTVYIYLKYKKTKAIQSPLSQQYDPVQPQETNTPFNPVTYTTVASVHPFLAGNL
jgi:hypothetical protein